MDKNFNNQRFTLAIETGIGSGSLSIFKNGKLLDYFSTDFSQLKADNLLENISELLQKQKINKTAIEKIFYSENPGSQTGLKIGAAVAKGLSQSLNTEIAGKDLFTSILDWTGKQKQAESIIILPSNRQFFAWKYFDNDGVCINAGQDKSFQTITEILNKDNNGGRKIFTAIDLIDDRLIKQLSEKKNEIFDLGLNLSFYIGI